MKSWSFISGFGSFQGMTNGFVSWVQAPLRLFFDMYICIHTVLFLIQLFPQSILNIRYMYNDTLAGEDDVVGRWHNIWEVLREMNLRSIKGRMSRWHHGCAYPLTLIPNVKQKVFFVPMIHFMMIFVSFWSAVDFHAKFSVLESPLNLFLNKECPGRFEWPAYDHSITYSKFREGGS